ncbi:hypothetical protein B484DRAFT_267714 [Ochromonadaceae sp. CCMP2298]|nr:hypothetical protein B484DRAFT_267714 [Ochromonadaceae sp. CCMP2298]
MRLVGETSLCFIAIDTLCTTYKIQLVLPDEGQEPEPEPEPELEWVPVQNKKENKKYNQKASRKAAVPSWRPKEREALTEWGCEQQMTCKSSQLWKWESIAMTLNRSQEACRRIWLDANERVGQRQFGTGSTIRFTAPEDERILDRLVEVENGLLDRKSLWCLLAKDLGRPESIIRQRWSNFLSRLPVEGAHTEINSL